ncbi:MAG TPA: hypothetical protein VKW08_11265 [Xanthobacteraceae bacterium]|nr:hypothetical protein [Xanthobacteraceae bacterium]
MKKQQQFLEKAAICERWISWVSDSDVRSALRQVRNRWIGLAIESESMSARSLATEVDVIESIELSLMVHSGKTIH